MTKIIPVASGKGGVGKTMFVANLGYKLAQSGKTTVLVDLDLGGSNLHTYLGVKNNKKGIGSFLINDELDIESLILKTDYKKLFMIMGDSLVPGAGNISYLKKSQIISSIKNITADYVILDLGAGSSSDTIDFFIINSKDGIIITTPEITAILNAYAFVKSFLFRTLFLLFEKNAKERAYLQKNLSKKIEGTSLNFPSLLQGIKSISALSCEKATKVLSQTSINVVTNKSKGGQSVNIVNNLRKISRENLGIDMKYIGYIPNEENLSSAILKRKLAVEILGFNFENSFNDIIKNIKKF